MDDLDAIRAALGPDDADGRDLIDFDRYPEATLNGIPLTREQRIDGAAMRPAWKMLMREMDARLPDLEQALGIGDETAKCGVCGQARPLNDPPPVFREVQVGTTGDGKPMVRPALDKPIRVGPRDRRHLLVPRENVMKLTVQNAEVKTATVEVKTLTISGKQVTLAVFRQLRESTLLKFHNDDTMTLNGVPWGWVNYHPDKCAVDYPHRHVVWQKGLELRRARVYAPYPEGLDDLPQLFVAV